ncbi:hypothetical protein HYH02_005465 [Chlamydomonas schloesseri]|uniref:Peptidase S1 domain-containing protein n=1 Tax=Chlamydomonas schloesseri TaxID=2026947 RepID=A0A835WKE4_9CHLO|nr:hypothetical protein HYH02_005465 [Chlamydomonas schloesseri]|eukprot:KAG2449309.1 hypothetical protein HYH02_005465 [Chlamydomonas schloesseri]
MAMQGAQSRDQSGQRGPGLGGTLNASAGLQPAASPPAEYGSRFASGFLRYLESGDLADVVVVVETDENVAQGDSAGHYCGSTADPAPQAPAPSSGSSGSGGTGGSSSSSSSSSSSNCSQYRLHGLLLAHHSAFFAAALGQQHFADSAARRIRLSLDRDVASHWPHLVRYFYTDRVVLDDRCALPLLALARQLLVPELDAACADYVRRRLCGGNCLAHLRAAVRFALHDLHAECVALAAQAFPLLYASPDLCGLPPASLLELLTAPGLQVHCELQVAEAVVRYLASTHVEPEAARALCAQIRFPYLDNATITRLAVAADPGPGPGPGLALGPGTAAVAAAAAAAGAVATAAREAEAPDAVAAGAPAGTPGKAVASAAAAGAQAAGTPGRDGSTGVTGGGAAGGGAAGGEVGARHGGGGDADDSNENDEGESLMSPSADTSPASSPAVSGGGAAPDSRPAAAPPPTAAPHPLLLHHAPTTTATGTAAAPAAPTSPVPRDLALEGALARLAAMEFAAAGKMLGGFPHPLDPPHAPPGALTATGPSHPLSLGGGGGGASATAAAAAAATVAAASPGRRPLAFFRSVGGGGGGGGGGGAGAGAASGPQAHALTLGPNASGGGASSPGGSGFVQCPQHPHLQAGAGPYATGVVAGGGGGGGGDGAAAAAAANAACGLVPPPRPSYCCALAHGLPGGAAWVDVALEALWEHLVPFIAVQVSGCGEGAAAHVTSSDPDCFFETNDSAEPLPWIEVILPRNVHVLQLHRYTFMHGHRRAGYYRARNFKTQIASRPTLEPPLPGTAQPQTQPQPHTHQQQQQQPQQGPPSSLQHAQGAAGVARGAGAASGPAQAGSGHGGGGGGCDPGTRYVDVPTRMTEQFDVSVQGGGGGGGGNGGGGGGVGPWRCMRLQATGAQEDGVHRLCVRALRMYGTARIDLMQQAGGFVVQPAWVLNARVEPHPHHPHHHPHSQHHGAGGPGGSGGYGSGGGGVHGGAGVGQRHTATAAAAACVLAVLCALSRTGLAARSTDSSAARSSEAALHQPEAGPVPGSQRREQQPQPHSPHQGPAPQGPQAPLQPLPHQPLPHQPPLHLHPRAPPRLLIQGGSKASVGAYPFVAVVSRLDGSYLCAGSLVHPRLVLTAAHCVTPAVGGTANPRVHLGLDRLEPGATIENRGARLVAAGAAALAALVGLGSTGGVAGGQALATRSLPHPRYNPGNFDYDAALLVLERDAPAGAKVVRLPDPGGGELLQSAPGAGRGGRGSSGGSGLTVLGWGSTEMNVLSEALRAADVRPLPTDTCGRLFGPYGTAMTPRMMCMTGRTCAGDSGGPLVMRGGGRDDDSDVFTLMGHVSFGFPRAKGQGCPAPNPATVFANLRDPGIGDWVRGVMAQLHQQSAGGAAGGGGGGGGFDALGAGLEAMLQAAADAQAAAAASIGGVTGRGGGGGGGAGQLVDEGR